MGDAEAEGTHPTITVTLPTLRLLFEDARRWWYHRRLRERGDVAEARRRERRSVRERLRYIEEATVLHVGRGGWTLYRRGGARLEGYGGIDVPFVQAAIRAGVPALDTTTVPDEWLIELLRGPCPADDPPGALRHAGSLGARVYNDFDDEEET